MRDFAFKALGAIALSGSILFGADTTVKAQDLLPEDNGLYHYHQPPRWRETEDHPLRIGAYILHPIGWILREGIFRPLDYAIGSTEFSRSFFGFREPFDFRNPLCFNSDVPDCHSVAPYNSLVKLGGTPGEEGVDTEVSSEEKVIFPDIAFDFDKSTLNPLGKARVRQVASLLSSMPTVNVVVEGHADYMGSDEYNMKLGARRADAVIKELADLGVDRARMSPVSYGESRPLYTEQTDWARAANRRVQFSVKGTEPTTTAAVITDSLPAPAK